MPVKGHDTDNLPPRLLDITTLAEHLGVKPAPSARLVAERRIPLRQVGPPHPLRPGGGQVADGRLPTPARPSWVTTLMGWRFRKSKSLFGGLLRLTLGRRVLSTSVGRRGVRVSRAPDGTVRRSVSIAGTGLFRRDVVRKGRRRH